MYSLPTRDQVWPASGPLRGNTVVTICGQNFGFNKTENFKSSLVTVEVAGVTCKLNRQDHINRSEEMSLSFCHLLFCHYCHFVVVFDVDLCCVSSWFCMCVYVFLSVLSTVQVCMFLCVCVCVCVCACVRACVCVCACVRARTCVRAGS